MFYVKCAKCCCLIGWNYRVDGVWTVVKGLSWILYFWHLPYDKYWWILFAWLFELFDGVTDLWYIMFRVGRMSICALPSIYIFIIFKLKAISTAVIIELTHTHTQTHRHTDIHLFIFLTLPIVMYLKKLIIIIIDFHLTIQLTTLFHPQISAYLSATHFNVLMKNK